MSRMSNSTFDCDIIQFVKQSKVLSFSVIYEEASEGGYIVSAPALPGCHTQGETIEEAEKNIKEAIELYMESLKAHKERLPRESRILQGRVEVSSPL